MNGKPYLCFVLTAAIFASCTTTGQFPKGEGEPSREIEAVGIKSPEQLTAFFMEYNPDADRQQIERIARYYVAESAFEGINSDIAFVQMCLETGFLTFGNLVTPDMHNYCGLGAIDAAHPGERFQSEQEGIRAHIQHLHAYGSSKPLRMPVVDPRYKYVNPKGKSPTIFGLAGTWAADRTYGTKLDGLLSRLASY